jgi:hypothetical protein
MNKLQKLLQGRKATYVEKTPEDVYREVAENSPHLDTKDIAGIGGLESAHGKFNKPLQGGSAEGLFQFQPPTAEHLQPGSSDSLSDMNTQSSLMTKYLDKNEQETPESAYALHNLGPTRGQKFLQASDKDLVSSVIPARIIRANPGLYNVKTVAEARELIKKQLNKGQESADITPTIMDLFKEKK